MNTDRSPLFSATDPGHGPAGPLTAGARVLVRNQFDGSWARGFEVLGGSSDGYRVRRLSDDAVLPAVFPGGDLRPEPSASG